GEGDADLAGGEHLVVTPIGERGLPLRTLHPFGAAAPRRLRQEVEKAPNLAAAINRGRRALHDLDVVGGGDGGRVIAAILDAAEAPEEVVTGLPAHEEAAGDAEVAAREGARRHGDEIVDGPDVVARDVVSLDHRDRPR